MSENALERAEEARERNVGIEYEQSLREPEEAVQAPLTCFTVQVFTQTPPNTWAQARELAERLTALMAETQENLNTGVLPGFTFKIREWDEE